jgi:hypothetical protein
MKHGFKLANSTIGINEKLRIRVLARRGSNAISGIIPKSL